MKIGATDIQELALFSEEEVKALEDRILERDVRGKTTAHVTCLVRGKEVQLKPEERVRQLWLARLVDKFGYAPSRIAVEYPITFGRDTSSHGDAAACL